MRQKKWMLVMAALLAGAGANAQRNDECSKSVEVAEQLYGIGRFEESRTLLQACLNRNQLDYGNRIQAFRLLALNYLATDSSLAAETSISALLQLKDNYESDTRDPERFRQELIRIKALQRINLVSSVSKKAEDIRRAPANITLITKEQILQRGYTDIIELLSDLAGFDVSIAYGVNYAAVYQRGLRTTITEKTLLLVDGIEENDLWSNVADISRQYPITNIKRVEVIYGPASTMYGPNAFVGVINIITKEPDDVVKTNLPGRTLGLHVQAGTGSYQSHFADVTVGYRKDLFGAVVTARLYESDRHDMSSQPFFDYNPAAYDRINYRNTSLLLRAPAANAYFTSNNLPATHPYYTVFRNPASNAVDSIIPTAAGLAQAAALDKQAYNQSTVGSGRVGWGNIARNLLVNAKINVGNFSLGFQGWQKMEGAGTLYTDQFAALNDVFWIPRRSYFYAKYERQISNILQFSSLSSYRIHALNNDTRISSVVNYARNGLGLRALIRDSVPFYNTQYFFQNSKQFRQELKMLYTPSANFYVLAGLEYRSSQLQGNYLNSTNVRLPEEAGIFSGDQRGGNQFDLQDMGVYAQANYRFKNQIGVTAGLRLDNNRIRQTGGFGNAITSRLVLDYARRGWVFKAIYSSGIQNVSNFNKFSTTGGRIPNPTLGTENIANYEVYVGKKLSEQFDADANIFYQDIRNIAGLVIIGPGQSQNQNVGRFALYGLQSNVNYRWRNFTATLNGTVNQPRQTANDVGAKVDQRVGDIADYRINVILNYLAFGKLNLNLRANVVGNRPTGTGTSVPANPERFGGYQMLNAAITYQNLLPGLSLQLCGNNLLNATIYHNGVRSADGVGTPSSLLQPGLNGFFKVNYEW